jgi:cytochrome c2
MTVLGSSPTALAAGDSSAGQTVFATHCVACHSTQPGKNEVGPSLAGIVGSKSASVPGYDFSPAMKDANVTWDDAISTNTSQTRPASFTGPGCSSISPVTPIGRMSSPTSTR